jgi:hypothetical protein
MKKSFIWSVALFASIFLVSCSTPHHATKWEYRQTGSLNEVNQLAEQGWSVVNFAVREAGPDQYLLRRPKP